MSKRKLIIWGVTGQSLVLEEILRDEFDIVALFDNREVEPSLKNIPFYVGKTGFTRWKAENGHHPGDTFFIAAIGGGYGSDRLSIHDYLCSEGLKPAGARHRTAFVAYNATIGEGCQLLANTAVCACARLGRSVIINTSASVDHECRLADGVHIGPGAKLAGNVEVNRNTFVGTGAVVLPRIKIGQNCTIGAGSVVTKDLPDNIMAYGNPCRIIKAI